jgi:hypothetical protein
MTDNFSASFGKSAFMYRLKLYALFINGENEAAKMNE